MSPKNPSKLSKHIIPQVKLEYNPLFCDLVIDLGKQGYTNSEIAKALEIPMSILKKWRREHQEFNDALEDSLAEAESYWVSQARANLENKKFNHALWSFIMKNKFGWRETVEQRIESTSHTRVDVTHMQPADLIAELNRVLDS